MNTRLLLVITLLSLAACSKQAVQVQLADGKVTGYVDDEVEHYLGIPYAQPPVGELRWRAPRPVQPWPGEHLAQDTANACPQFIPLSDGMEGSEDCLYLNVWTPDRQPAKPLPVMVWIHGGGFTAGQGAYSAGEGKVLAAQQDVVVVAMNYRLGIFGFLAHQALSVEDPDHPGSGNYGIMDQTEALRWVQRNISQFGGDPDNVTIFGQSAGGVSVCAQLASPLASGLFHRAAIMSGPCETPISPLAGAEVLGQQLEEGLGCTDSGKVLDCLRAAPAEEVAAVLPPDPSFAFGEGYTVWWPVQDNHVLPMDLMPAFRSGNFNQVPILNGATREEGTMLLWISHDMLFKPLQDEQYAARLQYLTGSAELGAAVEQQYPLSAYDSAFDALTAAFSDGFFKCFARHQSQALSHHVPTWSYQFDYQDAPFFIPFVNLKAYHGSEIQYVFGSPASLVSRRFDDEGLQLSQSMMGYWGNFARSGNPNASGSFISSGAPTSSGAPSWPAFDGSEKSLLFDATNSVASGLNKSQCQFWGELPYLRAPYPAPGESL